jgi:hypothetical protein
MQQGQTLGTGARLGAWQHGRCAFCAESVRVRTVEEPGYRPVLACKACHPDEDAGPRSRRRIGAKLVSELEELQPNALADRLRALPLEAREAALRKVVRVHEARLAAKQIRDEWASRRELERGQRAHRDGIVGR